MVKIAYYDRHLFDSLGTRRLGSNTREGFGDPDIMHSTAKAKLLSLKEKIAMKDNTCRVTKACLKLAGLRV